MAANTIGSGSLPVSWRYDASAAAPAGLCAASISSSPSRSARRSHSRRAGHSHCGQARDDRLGRRCGRRAPTSARGSRPRPRRSRADAGRPAPASAADTSRSRRRGVRIEERRLDRRARPWRSRAAASARQAADHQRHAGLGDAGLLERDLRQRVAEMALVIERDRRDRGDRRRQHVGGVEAAAEADLDDRDVDRGAPEDLERDRGRHFEEGRRAPSSAPSRDRVDRSTSRTCAVTRFERGAIDRLRRRWRRAPRCDRGAARCSGRCGGRRRAARARPSPRPSLCRWCRRCESIATRARDGRAPRGWRGCCRARA